jgi:hypothetical protein
VPVEAVTGVGTRRAGVGRATGGRCEPPHTLLFALTYHLAHNRTAKADGIDARVRALLGRHGRRPAWAEEGEPRPDTEAAVVGRTVHRRLWEGGCQ